jgi:hydroxymethylbilane synthase
LMRTIRIGTRGSALALTQTEMVRSALLTVAPGVKTEIVIIRTTGDILADAPFAAIGGKGVFVKDIEKYLLDDRVDIAVHSLKDMQAILPEKLTIGAFLERENPRDMLFSKGKCSLETLPQGLRVGTSSMRRRCQLKTVRPDLISVDIRGNVPTRLKRVGDTVDAVILAAAGVIRLGLPLGVAIDQQTMIPSPGQGIISVESRYDDEEVLQVIRLLDHADTRLCAEAERAFLGALGQDCRLPAGAIAHVSGDSISIHGMLGSSDEKFIRKMSMKGTTPDVGSDLAEHLKEQISKDSGS